LYEKFVFDARFYLELRKNFGGTFRSELPSLFALQNIGKGANREAGFAAKSS
jgi:hypothetical protein